MNLSFKNSTFVFSILIFVSLGCGLFSYETKTTETIRGRIKFVQVSEYREAGTHGGKGWVSASKDFYINGKEWLFQDNFDGCEANPNESIEVFKCFYIKDMKTEEFLLRMNGEDIEHKEIIRDDSINDNFGEWANLEDGKWLIYKDFFYNVLTDEKIEIKGLPDYPEKYFRAVSPDLQFVLYEGNCFYGFPEAPEDLKKLREKYCEESKDLAKKNLIPFWLTDIKTGETKFIKFSREKYDWLIWNQDKFEARNDWLKLFQKTLIWEKDSKGKFQLKN